MDAEVGSQFYQQAFQLFVEGCSNFDIMNTYKKLSKKAVIKLLQTEIDLVIDQIQKLVYKANPFSKDEEYQKRRERFILELAGEKRLVYNGSNANFLGQNTVKHFLKICRHYLKQGSLEKYNQQILHKLFRRYLSPKKQKVIKNPIKEITKNNQYDELKRKKRQMQAIKIEHQILLKKSKMIELQFQIQKLEESLSKDNGKRIDQQIIDQQAQDLLKQKSTNNLKSILKMQNKQPIKQTAKSEIDLKRQALRQALAKPSYLLKHQQKKSTNKMAGINKSKTKRSSEDSKSSQQSDDDGLKWKTEQQEYFIKLLAKYSIRDQQNLQQQLFKKFGKKARFSSHNVRDKKFQMFRQCRRKFLLGLKNKKMLSQNQYNNFAHHFQTVDNRRAYEFQSQFMSKYYFCQFGELPQKNMRQIIDTVTKQETRVLSQKYMKKKKIFKDLLCSPQVKITEKDQGEGNPQKYTNAENQLNLLKQPNQMQRVKKQEPQFNKNDSEFDHQEKKSNIKGVFNQLISKQ